MATPTLRDDGATVTLDVHGAGIEAAARLVKRTLVVAAQRGRHSVRVIHGLSTSESDPGASTIKHWLRNAIEQGTLPGVIDSWAGDGFTILSLSIAQTDPRPISIFDVHDK